MKQKAPKSSFAVALLIGCFTAMTSSALLHQQQEKCAGCENKLEKEDLNKPVNASAVDKAVLKGADYLLENCIKKGGDRRYDSKPQGGPRGDVLVKDELVLYATVYAHINEKHVLAPKEFEKLMGNDVFKKLFEHVLDEEPRYTYRAALKAMLLAAADKERYIEYIAECGQFLVDTQTNDGRWGYGAAKDESVRTEGKKPAVRPPRKSGEKDTHAKIALTKKKSLGSSSHGDNSNSQYAALGLRAVVDAGIEVPPETLQKAKEWWEKQQNGSGSWGYHHGDGGRGGSSVVRARYKVDESTPEELRKNRLWPMTAGALSSLAIYKKLLGECKNAAAFQKDASIAAGLAWLAKNYTLHGGSESRDGWGCYYYLYALERAGVLSNTAKFGTHDWYTEGANWLLAHQEDDGSWKGRLGHSDKWGGTVNTCFAILFLKRATEAVYTESSR